jgi:hypothetical protein
MQRLLTEDWDQMTAAANRSPRHVSSHERWYQLAKKANPTLSDEQAARLGEKMRTEHYKRMGRLSADARRLKRQAETVLAAIDEAEGPA